MTIVATKQNTKVIGTGENKSILYKLTMSGNYETGGYEVSGLSEFKKINRVRFEREGNMDESGNLYRVDSIDNSDATDPSFILKAYDFGSGVVALDEIADDQAHAESIYVEVEGIPLKGVDGDPW